MPEPKALLPLLPFPLPVDPVAPVDDPDELVEPVPTSAPLFTLEATSTKALGTPVTPQDVVA